MLERGNRAALNRFKPEFLSWFGRDFSGMPVRVLAECSLALPEV